MSSEERDKNLPSESAPEPGGGSWPLEDAPGASEHPEEQLGEQLGDTADSVTRGLRDLQDELLPPSDLPAAPAREPDSRDTTASSDQPGETSGVPPTADAPGTLAPEARLSAAALSGPQTRGAAPAAAEGTNDDRLLSMLAWLSMVIFQLPVVSVIQLLSENTKNRPFQRHHAITSLLFWGAAVAYEIVASVVFTIISVVTLGCGAFCLWIIFFVPHALALYYAFQAYSGKRVELPYLSSFGRRQGWL